LGIVAALVLQAAVVVNMQKTKHLNRGQLLNLFGYPLKQGCLAYGVMITCHGLDCLMILSVMVLAVSWFWLCHGLS